jgi:diguanylate cyclase (GGDEF)-like protein
MREEVRLNGTKASMMNEHAAADGREDLVRRIEELARENVHLKSLLLTDELTGLYNKRFFFLQLEVETARTRRTGQPCVLLMMDLDDFKSLNDTFGHAAGDMVLSHMGSVLWRNIRPTDFACRFGGDEFAVIMPSSQIAEGIRVAKRIQNSLAHPESRAYPEIGRRLSGSMGLAIYHPGSDLSVDDFFRQADLKLYEAKKAGKNGICCDQPRTVERSAVNETEREALFKLVTNVE